MLIKDSYTLLRLKWIWRILHWRQSVPTTTAPSRWPRPREAPAFPHNPKWLAKKQPEGGHSPPYFHPTTASGGGGTPRFSRRLPPVATPRSTGPSTRRWPTSHWTPHPTCLLTSSVSILLMQVNFVAFPRTRYSPVSFTRWCFVFFRRLLRFAPFLKRFE